MVQKTLFCPTCSEILDPNKNECPRCGEFIQFDPDEIMMQLALKARKKSIIPWGLIIFFALYFAGAYCFVKYYYKTTPEYKAAEHYDRGDRILGDDDGKSLDTPMLFAAMEEFVRGTQYTPLQDYGYQRIETITRRLYERKVSLTKEQQRDIDALAKMRAIAIERRKPVLLVGIRDTWDIDALEAMPRKIFNYSIFIAIGLMGFWIFRSWRIRRYYDQMATRKIEERRVEAMDDVEYAKYKKEQRRLRR